MARRVVNLAARRFENTDVLHNEQNADLSVLEEIQSHPRSFLLFEALIEGESATKVARLVQRDLGILQDVELDTIARTLRRWRGEAETKARESESPDGNQWPKTNPKWFPELHQLQFFMEMQAKRIELETATERSLGKLFSGTYREFLAFVKMAETVLHWKKELGLFPSKEEMMKPEPSLIRYPAGFEKTLNNPQSRHKILDAVDSLLSAATFMAKNEKPEEKRKKHRPKRKRAHNKTQDCTENLSMPRYQQKPT
jgi:hypothetical protein